MTSLVPNHRWKTENPKKPLSHKLQLQGLHFLKDMRKGETEVEVQVIYNRGIKVNTSKKQ